MPHLVATLIYLPQNYSYYIRGGRSLSKGLAQAKITKKSVLLYRDGIPVFHIFDMVVKKEKIRNFASISSLTGKCAAQKLKSFCSSSLWTCLHDMVILISQNKIIDFLMILA